MSTKATMAYDDTFHFYHEMLNDDHVYLELNTTHFEAGYGRVMLPIPMHIWETIRQLGGARLELVDCSEHDLLHLVCLPRPTDFAPYGLRQREAADCSCGCKYFVPLDGSLGADWGVCTQPRSPRAGLLTFEHQGCEFFASDDRLDAGMEREEKL